jgi:hypothetical protein
VKKVLSALFAVSCIVFFISQSNAALINCGDSGEYFYDQEADLYWYDPGVFSGWTIEDVNAYVENSQAWRWAGPDEIAGLCGALTVREGAFLTDILGVSTYTTVSWCYWIGFMNPDGSTVAARLGWNMGTTGTASEIELYTSIEDVQTNNSVTSAQIINGAILCGAWLYSEDDPLGQTAPVPEPSTIFLIGTGLVGVAGVMRKYRRQ